MILSLILLGLLIAIAVRAGSQGFFGGLIMTVLTIVCAAASLGTHEYVTTHWLAGWLKGWNPDYAMPIAVIVFFGVPLLILRLIFDRLIRRACLLPAIFDRVGGGVCGVVTSLVTVGMVALALQMIPFNNGSIIGWSRFDVADPDAQPDRSAKPPEVVERGLCFGLNPDKVTAGLVSVLSNGVLSGGSEFYAHHPRFVQELGWVGTVHAEISRYAPPKSISVARTRAVDYVFKLTPGNERNNEPPTYEPESPPVGNLFRMIRVGLRNEARDIRKAHNFGLRQFRLVGEQGGELRQYHPIAVQQENANDPMNRHIRSEKKGASFWPVLDGRWAPRDDNNNEVELVFELPESFQPQFLEYKREARVAVSFVDTGTESVTQKPPSADSPSGGLPAPGEPVVTPSPTPSGDTSATGSSSRRRRTREAPENTGGAPQEGRSRVQTVGAASGSRFSDELPVPLRTYQQEGDTQIERDRLVQGHLIAEVDAQAGGIQRAVTHFSVPDNKRLLHLSSVRLQAGSTLGKALSQAVGTLQNYFVEDSRGNRHTLAGKYAIAAAGGKQVVEIQYFSEPTGTMGGLGPFRRVDEKNLTPNDTYVLLFLVDPGVQIVRFSSGGAASRSDDLTTENLVAPP